MRYTKVSVHGVSGGEETYGRGSGTHCMKLSKFHVNTFCGHLQLAALGDLDLLPRLVAGRCLGVLDYLDELVALKNLAEDDVAAIKPAEQPRVSIVFRQNV